MRCAARREGDEWVCVKCKFRWDANEDSPCVEATTTFKWDTGVVKIDWDLIPFPLWVNGVRVYRLSELDKFSPAKTA